MTNDEIRHLLEVTVLRIRRKEKTDRFGDWQIFVGVLGEEKARAVFSNFLRDVSTCPPEVIAWCQAELRKPT